jgi:AcrR family transcriptional regulator
MRVTAEIKEATRQSILSAAGDLFRVKGFDATTTRDVAAAANIATGTLFNYFSTKEAIASTLVLDAMNQSPRVASKSDFESFEEALFAHVASILRRLRPYRKMMAPVLETTLSPLACAQGSEAGLRSWQLEQIAEIARQFDLGTAMTPMALQMFMTLFYGVLSFWSNDRSPKQEETLALLDQSIEMFVGWLQRTDLSSETVQKEREEG